MEFSRPAASAAASALIGLGTGLCGPAAALTATTTFTSADNPGGGHLIKGFRGAQSSLDAASIVMLRELQTQVGIRPAVVSAVQNPSEHSPAFFFRTTRNGQPLTGMSLITAGPGVQATGEAASDTDARFPKTIGPMLQQLRRMKNPAPPTVAAVAPIHFAPAEPLVVHNRSASAG